MKIRTPTGVTLDGFMAMPDGYPAWHAVPTLVLGESHGFPEFIATCEAIIIGRNVFDFTHAYWKQEAAWPWEGYPVYVLTSHPLPADARPDVTASQGGPAELVEQLRAAGLSGDAQLLGGAETIRSFLTAGAVDELGLCVLPVILGDGLPLFTAGTLPQQSIQLVQHRAFPDGTMHLVYRKESE